MPGERPISSLILAEYYDAGDGTFVERLSEYRGDMRPVLGVIERWKKDRSATARRMKIAFVLDGTLYANHRVIFKRLFKQAWHDRDHDLVGACMVRLDRSVRRGRARRYRYEEGTITSEEVLRVTPRGMWNVFSGPTTHYLRRRAWRYFRRLGFKEPAAYTPAVAGALVRYTDDDVRRGENLLDNWGLMHACFGKSDVLTFNARHTNLKRGLGELQAAPMFERLWAEPASAAVLLSILLDARCRPVRVWAIQLLKRHHTAALASIEAGILLRLIDHTDEDVAAFAAELLSNATVVASLPMTTWLKLLGTRNVMVVSAVVEAFRKHVSFDRVTLAQAAELATHAATTVVRLALDILADRPVRNDADRAAIASMAAAKCHALGREVGGFGLKVLNVGGSYQRDQVIAFFDASLKSVREGAFAALEDRSPAGTDPAFWAGLLESPYDDVRSEMVDRLKKRQSLPGASAASLAGLWQSVLLNIHRGGRAKLSALKQISRQITLEPQSAAVLLPVMAVAIRSVRPPEARHGLAAIVSAVEQVPSLAADVAKYLPELQLDVLQSAGGPA